MDCSAVQQYAALHTFTSDTLFGYFNITFSPPL